MRGQGFVSLLIKLHSLEILHSLGLLSSCLRENGCELEMVTDASKEAV